MFSKVQKSLIAQLVVILCLLGGLFSVPPAKASSDAIPQINISTPSYPIGMKSRESKLITYSLAEFGNVSGEITSRIHRFYTQYDVPLSDSLGPYATSIKVNPLATSTWNELFTSPRVSSVKHAP